MRSSPRSLPSGSRRLALVSLLLAMVVAGCSASPAASVAGSAATPVISGAWVRPPAAAGLPAAGYLTITNSGSEADALIGASSTVATSVETHETSTVSGMTGMQMVTKIAIPAGSTVKLEPGGYHLMMMGVKALAVGETVEIVLTFEKAGKVTVKAEVKNG